MSTIELTQSEADRLILTEKHSTDQKPWNFPELGGSISIPLISSDKRDNFFLDIYRGKINLKKGSYQNRALTCVPLLRLDFSGPSHQNPDGSEIACPHLHIYKEGFGDKWAYEVPKNYFRNLDDIWIILDDFMNYCHIVKRPNIIRGLFS